MQESQGFGCVSALPVRGDCKNELVENSVREELKGATR